MLRSSLILFPFLLLGCTHQTNNKECPSPITLGYDEYVVSTLHIISPQAVIKTFEVSCKVGSRADCTLQNRKNSIETYIFPQDYKCNLEGILYKGNIKTQYTCKTIVNLRKNKERYYG